MSTTPPKAQTLPAMVGDLAATSPGAPALVAGPVRATYAELNDAARRGATALERLGIGPGDGVGLLASNTADWTVVALATMRRGARVDAFNTWVKTYELDFLLRTSRCPVLVMSPSVRSSDLLTALAELVPEVWRSRPGEWRSERFPELRSVVLLDDADQAPIGALRWQDLLGAVEPETCESAARAEDVAFVLYTSGSTRDPKAVPLRQRDTIVNAFHIGERMGLTAEDRVWLGSPLFWSYGGANAWPATVTHGACLVLQEHFEAHPAAELMAKEEVTAAYLLPTITDALVGVGDLVRSVSSLRTGLTIGRPDEVARAIDELDIPELCNVYGSTEVYGNCCVTPHDAPQDWRVTTQGPPLPGVELRTVDTEGRVQEIGELGELQVRGRVTPGYLNADSPTAINDDGWFRTGDQLRIRPDGAVEFAARLTEMIKTSGINVAPAEVEGYLSTHPSVAEVAVVGAPHPSRGEVVMAFVVASGDIDGAALREYCRAGIASFKVPWDVVVLSELPRTGTGKLTRKALVERATRHVRAIAP